MTVKKVIPSNLQPSLVGGIKRSLRFKTKLLPTVLRPIKTTPTIYGFVSSKTDREGNVTTHIHDNLGRACSHRRHGYSLGLGDYYQVVSCSECSSKVATLESVTGYSHDSSNRLLDKQGKTASRLFIFFD